MNLKKYSGSSDFDNLGPDTSMQIGPCDEQGLSLMLGPYFPVIITISEGKAKVEVYFRELKQSMSFELPLGLAHEMEIPLEWALGILHKQGLEIEIPLARTLQAVCLLLEQPLKINPIKLIIAISETGEKRYGIEWKGRFGRTRKETVKTLKALLKLLKEGD